MIRTNSQHSIRALASVLLIFAAPLVALADVGEGKVNFAHNLEAIFNRARFNNDFYTGVLGLPGPGSGNLTSQAIHGSADSKAFPANQPWDQQTASIAAGESTSQRTVYEKTNISPDVGFNLFVTTATYSDSQAADIGTDTRESFSQSITSVQTEIGLQRKGTGLAPDSNFYVEVHSPPGTARLEAMHTGNGFGQALVIAALTGRLVDNATGIQPVDLPNIEIFSKEILSNNVWESPEASASYFFTLPEWTRLSGASFTLTIGLKVTSITYARAGVPEPSSFVAVGMAFTMLALRRRAKRH